MEEKEEVVLVDANAFVHSTFHGYSPCLDCKGVDQKVLLGLMNTLVDLTYQLPRIDHIFMIFDPVDGSLYRKSVFPSYKANRPPADPELVRQREAAIKIISDYIGLPIVTYAGVEADDIIGSISYCLRDKYNITIVSPDKDLAQLVTPNVRLMKKIRTKQMKGYKFLGVEDVYRDYGVYPHQIPDWLSLMGDEADNLPGLYKVGEKTASDLLKKYRSLEHLLAIHHELDNIVLKEKIQNAISTLPIIKQLATIKCDLPLQGRIEEALLKAQRIRSHEEYKSNLQKLHKYFNWPEHYSQMFIKE